MARTKEEKTLDYKDMEKTIREAMDVLFERLRKILAEKTDLSELGSSIGARFDRIERHLIEIKAEMRTIRTLYQFWADRHMSPQFMEEYLKEQKKLELHKPKRLD